MMESGIVCVCNSTYCDTLEFTEPTNIGDVLIISSSEKGLRFSQLTTKFVKAKKPVSSNQRDQITIDRSQRFQKIIGFGNSITGAVSINLDLLSKELRNYVYKSYFNNETGLALNMLRTPIGGSDFDIEPWAYNETPEKDLNLTGFSKLDTRDEVKVKHLKELRSVSGNYNIKLLAAAWSPPRWMKQKYEWSGFNYLKPEYYETWALYHVRFLELMRKEGIEFWSISTGNEPLNGNFAALLVPFLSLGWDPISQGNWVANYFGPMLRKSFHEILIISNDDQSFTIPQWFKLMYGAYPESKNYISGHAFHLYWNTITGRRGVGDTYNLYPDKFIMMTEGVNGVLPWDGGNRPVLGSWQRGENYVADIILSLNVYVSAWIDWNMILDENGGPNYTYLKTDSSIITSKGSID
jgi:glucosylceramidase